jgi:glutathione S-transferase
MSGSYRLFGAETSAYSTKMRSYLRYKGVVFDWLPRTQDTEDELRALSRFSTLPVLVTASGFAVHDTTPMMEALEADTPEPSATPADPALAFLACVLEEYADAWLAKAAYHYRWTRKKDQRLAAARAIEDYYTREAPADRKGAEDAAIARMLDQMRSIGLEGEFGATVEKSFKRFVKLLDDHLRKHLCIFGGRPSIADFAIAGQLIQMMKDPTPAKIIEKDGEFVAKWCEFLADAKPSGPFAAFEDLKDTLAPIFASELVAGFLPWAAENLESSLAGKESFEITLGKDAFTLTPLRSAARSFRELRRKFVSGQEIETLKAFTDETGATVYLQRPPRVEGARPEREPRRDHRRETQAPDGDAASGVEAEAAEGAIPQEPREDGEGGARRKRRRRRRGGRGGAREDGASAGPVDESGVDGFADGEGDDGEDDEDRDVQVAAASDPVAEEIVPDAASSEESADSDVADATGDDEDAA